jgi:small subunit ribosomal protein S2
MANVVIPELKDILRSGLQFGHNTSKWEPKMSQFIYTSKNGIHVVDVVQSRERLQAAAEAAQKLASQGEVLFVASKRQAAEIVKAEAIRAGSHFIVSRWPGGLFTNFQTISRSIKRLNELERLFNEGVEGRTKYEVSRMKSEWQRLTRLYAGVKNMAALPKLMVVIDPRFEKVAVREAKKSLVPVIALVDTNTDPDMIDYVIPGNDDALGSITLVVKVLADAVSAGNGGNGVKHSLSDYSSVEVEIRKTVESVELESEAAPEAPTEEEKPKARIKLSSAKQAAAAAEPKVKAKAEKPKKKAKK